MSPDDDRVELRRDDLVWRVVDDGVVALDRSRAVFLGTNATGAALWALLADGATRASLASELERVHRLDRPRAEADVDAFLESLAERGLTAPG